MVSRFSTNLDAKAQGAASKREKYFSEEALDIVVTVRVVHGVGGVGVGAVVGVRDGVGGVVVVVVVVVAVVLVILVVLVVAVTWVREWAQVERESLR